MDGLDKVTKATARWDETLIVFPTSKDATNYLTAMNKTAYSLASEESGIQAYRKATGHAPKIDKFIVFSEGSPAGVSGYRIHGVKQLDNLIKTSMVTYRVHAYFVYRGGPPSIFLGEPAGITV